MSTSVYHTAVVRGEPMSSDDYMAMVRKRVEFQKLLASGVDHLSSTVLFHMGVNNAHPQFIQVAISRGDKIEFDMNLISSRDTLVGLMRSAIEHTQTAVFDVIVRGLKPDMLTIREQHAIHNIYVHAGCRYGGDDRQLARMMYPFIELFPPDAELRTRILSCAIDGCSPQLMQLLRFSVSDILEQCRTNARQGIRIGSRSSYIDQVLARVRDCESEDWQKILDMILDIDIAESSDQDAFWITVYCEHAADSMNEHACEHPSNLVWEKYKQLRSRIGHKCRLIISDWASTNSKLAQQEHADIIADMLSLQEFDPACERLRAPPIRTDLAHRTKDGTIAGALHRLKMRGCHDSPLARLLEHECWVRDGKIDWHELESIGSLMSEIPQWITYQMLHQSYNAAARAEYEQIVRNAITNPSAARMAESEREEEKERGVFDGFSMFDDDEETAVLW